MVKRVPVLEQATDEAGARVAYERTPLARRAVRARRRLAGLVALGALVLAIEAAVARSPLAGVGALALGLTAWGVARGRLGASVAAAFAAVLAILLPLRFLLMGGLAPADLVALLVSVALGLAALPDLVTVLRDHELQHAYGLWARRE